MLIVLRFQSTSNLFQGLAYNGTDLRLYTVTTSDGLLYHVSLNKNGKFEDTVEIGVKNLTRSVIFTISAQDDSNYTCFNTSIGELACF